MKERYFGNIGPTALILLLLSLPLWNSCKEEKIQTPGPDQGCGFGEGEYEFYLVNSVPDSFDCNASGSFVITIRPDSINPSYSGIDVFNRLYFILDNGSDIYYSNYVEFLSDNSAHQELEWGGSLPTGDYVVRGRMRNIQLYSTCEDSIYKAADKNLGWVYITEFANPAKTMEIEYFCQDSDIGAIDRYDVFLSPNTQEYIDIAFNVANTTYNLIPYELHLEPRLIEFSEEGIKEYIGENKNYSWHMFLCGIKGFKDIDGYSMPNQLGVTYEADWFTCAPSESTGSLVAVKTAIDYAASDEYRMDYNDLVTGMTIHELGLQRGAVEDEHIYTKPYPEFCVGHRSLIHYEGTDRDHPYLFVRHWNPHFCDQCITGIKNITW